MKLNKKDILYTIGTIAVAVVLVSIMELIIEALVLGLHIALTNPIYVIGLSIIGLVVVFLLPSNKS